MEMYIRSTGLGRTRLRARIERVADEDEEIIKGYGSDNKIKGLKLAMKSSEPFEWDVEVIIEEEDVPRLIKVALTRKTLGFLIRSLISKLTGRNSGGGK